MKIFLVAAITTASVCLASAPLLRAGVPGWQVLGFAACSALAIFWLVWRVLSPPRRKLIGGGPALMSEDMRKILTPILEEGWGPSKLAVTEEQLARTREMRELIDKEFPKC